MPAVAKGSEDRTRTAPAKGITILPRAGMVRDWVCADAKSVRVTVAGRAEGLTSTANAAPCGRTKSAEGSRGTVPSSCSISHDPVATKIPSPGAEASASIQPSNDCRPNNSETSFAYCCPAASVIDDGLRTPGPATRLPFPSKALSTTDIPVLARNAIPVNTVALWGLDGMIFTCGWYVGSNRTPADTPTSLSKPAPLIAFTAK